MFVLPRRRSEGKALILVGLANGCLIGFNAESLKVMQYYIYNKLLLYYYFLFIALDSQC